MRVIAFDLDDTLYLERDYVESGLRTLWDLLLTLGYIDDTKKWKEEWLADRRPIDRLISDLCLDSHLKEQLIWAYRLHSPKIRLAGEVKLIIEMLLKRGDQVVIITDGRSIAQRQKVRALGLEARRVMISEEYGSTKPDNKRFVEVMKEYGNHEYWYIGDNVSKDFIAPNRLGWKTVKLERDGQLYMSDLCVDDDGIPDNIVSGFKELQDLLSES